MLIEPVALLIASSLLLYIYFLCDPLISWRVRNILLFSISLLRQSIELWHLQPLKLCACIGYVWTWVLHPFQPLCIVIIKVLFRFLTTFCSMNTQNILRLIVTWFVITCRAQFSYVLSFHRYSLLTSSQNLIQFIVFVSWLTNSHYFLQYHHEFKWNVNNNIQ